MFQGCLRNAFLSHSKEELVSKLRSKDTAIFTPKRSKMSKMTKSKKYQGVYHRKAKDGEVTYYFTYQNEMKKTQYQKVGTKSEGVTEEYVNEQRLKTTLSMRTGEAPPKVVRNNKRYNTTVDEISDFYFKNHRTSSSEKRLRQYKYRLKSFFGHMSIYNVNIKHLDEFRDKTLEEVSEQTTIVYLELLGTLFNFYINNTKSKLTNPVQFVNKPRVNNRRERFLSREELTLVFNEISNDITLTLFLSLSLCTGARKSTVLNYCVKDVDIEHKFINSYDFKNKTTYKSFLDDRTIEMIEDRIETASGQNDRLIYKPGIHDLERWVSREFKIIFDNLFNNGLELDDRKNRVVLHTLRHTVLSHLGMKGCSEFLIMKISNHKSTQMVARYVKLSEDSGRGDIDSLWT